MIQGFRPLFILLASHVCANKPSIHPTIHANVHPESCRTLGCRLQEQIMNEIMMNEFKYILKCSQNCTQSLLFFFLYYICSVMWYILLTLVSDFMWIGAVQGVQYDCFPYCSQKWSHQSSQAQTQALRMSILCFCSSSESWTSQRRRPNRWDSTLMVGSLFQHLGYIYINIKWLLWLRMLHFCERCGIADLAVNNTCVWKEYKPHVSNFII